MASWILFIHLLPPHSSFLFSSFLFYPLIPMDPTETCASCQKPLIDPKTLPCLHSHCTHCIEELVKKENDSKKNNGAKVSQSATSSDDEPNASLCCPQCSTAFVIPTGGVAALSADSFVLGLVKQKEAASKDDDPNDVKCACNEESAIVHCALCELFFGENCQKGHKWSKHEVVNVDDYFKESEQTTRILFCQLHPTSEIDTFCKTDDQPMCAKCGVSSHQSHSFVPLKDISLDFSAEITKALQPVRLSFSF